MKGTVRLFTYLGVAVATLAVSFGASAQSEARGRISFADESGLIKGQEDTDWSYAALNSLVMPGDTIWADDSGALEVEFSGGTFVRLADGSRLDVLDVPPNGLLRGVLGSFYIQRVSRSNGDVLFETPLGTLTVEPDSQVRVDILDGGATTVSVRWGRATILPTGDAVAVPVNAGMRSYIDPGYLPSDPVSFNRNEEDSFDTWNRDRARYLAEGSAPAPIEYGSSAPVGVAELGRQGEWVYVDNTPYWRPTVVVNYVPYRYGYWSYVPRHGYVWCGNYPFSYVTSHYGHWRYHNHHGWIWRYSGYYRPAYAYTVSYGDYFVWAPLGYNGYPVYSTAYAGFALGGVNFSFGFSSYAYHYDVLHCRPRVFAVHNHIIYNKHKQYHHKPHYWRIEADARPYQGVGRPHWPGESPRSYQPQAIYRGATLASDSGRRAAPERARALEARRPDRSGVPVRPESRLARTTPVDRSQRAADVRQARVDSPSTARVARAQSPDERGGVPSRSRTLSNDQARDADPLSRGSLSRPRDPSERRSIDVSPNGRIETRDRDNSPADRPTRSVDVGDRQRSVGNVERTRPDARSDAPQRPNVTRPERPDVARPDVNGTRPTRPSTVDRVDRQAAPQRPDRTESVSRTRPDVIRGNTVTPQRPEPPTRPSTQTRPVESPRPQVTSPRPSGDPRPAIQSRPTRPETPDNPRIQTRPEPSRPQSPENPRIQTRPQVARPQVQAPQRPEPSRVDVQRRDVDRPNVAPETTRRQVTSTRAPQTTTQRAPQITTQRAPQVTTDRAPQVTRREVAPAPQQRPNVIRSAPSQRFSQPDRGSVSTQRFQAPASRPPSQNISPPSRPSYQQQRSSSPDRSSFSAPSRSSSPRMSAPQSSGGSSRSFPSSGGGRSSGGGPQRTPR